LRDEMEVAGGRVPHDAPGAGVDDRVRTFGDASASRREEIVVTGDRGRVRVGELIAAVADVVA
jgi:hypothetical protein